jgi:hypothetical protein
MENTSELEITYVDEPVVALDVSAETSADNAPKEDFVLPKFVVPSNPVGYNIANVDGSVDSLAADHNAPLQIDPKVKEAAQLAIIERMLKQETRKAEAERARKGRLKKRKKTAKMAKASRRRNR